MSARAAGARRTPSWTRALRTEWVVLALMVALLPALPGPTPWSLVPESMMGGAALWLSAAGVLLVYRACGFLNLAQVQLALFAGVFFEALVRGRMLLTATHAVCEPCVGLQPGPTSLSVNIVVAMVLSIGGAALVSWLLHLLVMQRFAKAPPLMATVVTVFVAQALGGLQPKLISALVKADDVEQGRAARDLSDLPWHRDVSILGQPVALWSVILAAVSVVLVSCLWVSLRRGRWGRDLRANAADPARARTLGIDSATVAARAWAWAGLLAGVVGVLTKLASQSVTMVEENADVAGLPQTASALVLLLAVVVFARFVSLSRAAAAAVVFTLFTNAVGLSFASAAPVEAAWVFVIGAMLLMQQRDTTNRAVREDTSGMAIAAELPPIPRELRDVEQVRSYVRAGALVLGVVLLGSPALMSPAGLSLLVSAFVFGMVALSLLVLTGWAGQVSLGQFGFAAIGAYVAVVSGIPFLLALPLAAVAGAAASVVVGLPALRLRGIHLAISTLAFAVSVQAILFDRRFLGQFVPAQITAPTLLGFDLRDGRIYYYVTLTALAATAGAVLGLRRSRLGRVLVALRANEAGAQAFGVNPTRARLTAFMVSGAIAAVAGALGAFHFGELTATSYPADLSISVFLYTLVGGLGGLSGPLLGMAFYAAITFFFADNPLVAYAGAGVGAVLLLIAVPGGLAQLAVSARDSMLKRLAYRLRLRVPSLMGDGGVAAAMGKAPFDEKRRPLVARGETPLKRYRPEGQWAFARLGSDDQERSRVGARKN